MDSVILLIESKLADLPASERKVAEYILRGRKKVMYQSVTQIAAETGASPSAVVRLCRSLGIPGVPELKIMLARDVFGAGELRAEASPSRVKEPDRSPSRAQAAKIIENNIDSLRDLKASLEIKDIKEAARLIDEASYLFAFGVGLSSSIAFDFYHKMCRLGHVCGFAQDPAMQSITATNMKAGTTGMVISHSGMTAEVVRSARIAKEHGAALVGITGNPRSDVAHLCDVVLPVPFSEPMQRLGASSTRIAQLTLIDVLFSELVRRNPARAMDHLGETNIG